MQPSTVRSMGTASLAVAGLLLGPLSFAAICQSAPPPPYERTWEVTNSDVCDTGPGNPNSSDDLEDLGGAFDDRTWTKRGDVTSNGDFSSLLNVSLNPGSRWGRPNVSGTWTLTPNFWLQYGNAVITIHVGGNPDRAPDDFGAFIINYGATSGSWSFNQVNGVQGGGLSNVAIWTSGPPRKVPEPATLGLLGLGLASVGLMRRRRKLR
jgi:hypothetical protein